MADMPFETGPPPPGPPGRFKREHILLGIFAVAALGITAFAFIKLGRSRIDVGSNPDYRSAFDSQVVYRQPDPPPRMAQAQVSKPVSPMPIYRGLEAEKTEVPPPPPPTAEGLFDWKFVHREEERIRKLWLRKLKESANVRAYRTEWMSHPDLKSLNDRYERDEINPIAFIKELSGSKNFYKLVAKYATKPEMISTLVDALQAVSPEAMRRASRAMDMDDTVGKFVDGFGNEVGVPLRRWTQGKPPSQEEILKTIMQKKPWFPGKPESPPAQPGTRPKTKKRFEGGWKF